MMTTIVKKSTRGRVIVTDACVGTVASANACLMLPGHRRFIGGDIEVERMNEATASLLLVFAKQALSPDLGIQVSHVV